MGVDAIDFHAVEAACTHHALFGAPRGGGQVRHGRLAHELGAGPAARNGNAVAVNDADDAVGRYGRPVEGAVEVFGDKGLAEDQAVRMRQRHFDRHHRPLLGRTFPQVGDMDGSGAHRFGPGFRMRQPGQWFAVRGAGVEQLPAGSVGQEDPGIVAVQRLARLVVEIGEVAPEQVMGSGQCAQARFGGCQFTVHAQGSSAGRGLHRIQCGLAFRIEQHVQRRRGEHDDWHQHGGGRQ
ncbi:hypothetical protein AYR66_07130 [Noviherbaspirillum denitrificans]|uniref:Uncharacterized protein n=1 Tax=Noviherbaspirillum denitrificans TaxID=1968433 RepID=A0A254TAX4_9BURK|nr:hypothetical protein AYR66_07130 [Noviherbaspirillum denitrificans]